jgi:hypothetical protein
VVRGGELGTIGVVRQTGQSLHLVLFVFSEMLRQITRDYGSLPDPRTLSIDEIAWWYEGLIPELKKFTTPPKKPR